MKPMRARHGEDAVAEQLEREPGLAAPVPWDHTNSASRTKPTHGHDHDRSGAPRVRRAAEARERDDRRERAGEQHGAAIVDRVLDAVRMRVEDGGDHEQRERADRQVDVEDPAPGEVVDEEAADQRPDHRGDAEHRAEHALVLAAVARRDDVADDGDRRHQQAARAEALEAAERDQLGHVLRDAAERGADEEGHDRDLEHDLASVEVAELPVQRAGHRRREQVGGHDPGQVLEAAEVADDRRQRRRHDRLVERREQDDEHQRAEDDPNPGRRPVRAGERRHAMEGSGNGRDQVATTSRPGRSCRRPEHRPRQHLPRLLNSSYAKDREDQRAVAAGADPRAVPRPAREGHRGAVHRRVRPRLRAGHVPVRGLRRGAVRVGRRSTTPAAAGRRSSRRRARTRSRRRPTAASACAAPRCCARAAAATWATSSRTGPTRPGSATASTRPR